MSKFLKLAIFCAVLSCISTVKSPEHLRLVVPERSGDTINLFPVGSGQPYHLKLVDEDNSILAYYMKKVGYIYHDYQKDSLVSLQKITDYGSLLDANFQAIGSDTLVVLHADKYAKEAKDSLLEIYVKAHVIKYKVPKELTNQGHFMSIRANRIYYQNTILAPFFREGASWYNSCPNSDCFNALAWQINTDTLDIIDFKESTDYIIPKSFSYPASDINYHTGELYYYHANDFGLHKYSINLKEESYFKDLGTGSFNAKADRKFVDRENYNADKVPNDDYNSIQILGVKCSQKNQGHLLTYLPAISSVPNDSILYAQRPLIYQLREASNKIQLEFMLPAGEYVIDFSDQMLYTAKRLSKSGKLVVISRSLDSLTSLMPYSKLDFVKAVNKKVDIKYKRRANPKKAYNTLLNQTGASALLIFSVDQSCNGCVKEAEKKLVAFQKQNPTNSLALVFVSDNPSEVQKYLERNNLQSYKNICLSKEKYARSFDKYGFYQMTWISQVKEGFTKTILGPQNLGKLEELLQNLAKT
jgi:hypothetical protein